MERSEVSRGEAAELLGEVRRQQIHARRSLGVGWLVALLLGGAMFGLAIADSLGVAAWASAVVSGCVMGVVGGVAMWLIKRNEIRFGSRLDVPVQVWIGAVAGLLLATVLLAVRNDAKPASAGGTIGMGLAVAVAGGVLLVARREPRWLSRVLIATGLAIALVVAVSPHSYLPRELIGGGLLLGYATYAWVRAGRQS